MIFTGISSFEVKPLMGQMVSLHSDKELLKKVIFSSFDGKVHYIVPRNNNTIILGCTMEDIGFEKQITEEGINAIAEYERKLK